MPRNPDEIYQLLAAESILRRLRLLTKRIDGVQDGRDREDLHQMRVGSRRLRSAMSVFKDCLPKKKRKSWRKSIRRITRGLGPARDLDVQMQCVEEELASEISPEARAGLQALLEELREQRERLQPDIRSAMQAVRGDEALRELRKAMRAVRKSPPEGFSGDYTSRAADAARNRAGAKIARRMRDFLALEPWVLEPEARDRHHEMRIAAKRLRYAMEIFDPLWGGALAGPTARVKAFQSTLGELHDCDVWLESLPARIEAASAEHRVGLERFRNDRHRRREDLFAAFVEEYRAAQAERFWENLHKTLHTRPRPAVGGDAE